MRAIDKVVSAVAVGLTTMGAAAAADVISIPTSADASIPVHEEKGFDWSGFYAGVYGGVQDSAVGGTQYALGVQAGVNAQFDFYLVGAEVAVQGLAGGAVETSYGQILGRAGLAVTDDVIVYAAGGYGIDLGPPDEQDFLLGGGVEMAVTDVMSVRAQYTRAFPSQGGNAKNQFSVGASFHF